MTNSPFPPKSHNPPAPGWEAPLREHVANGLPEIDLISLKLGDRLLVLTEHTAYTLVMLERGEAELTTNRADRPSGRVRINGCTFGASSTIKPDSIFSGGNLEFVHCADSKVTTTTTIRALQLTQGERS